MRRLLLAESVNLTLIRLLASTHLLRVSKISEARIHTVHGPPGEDLWYEDPPSSDPLW